MNDRRDGAREAGLLRQAHDDQHDRGARPRCRSSFWHRLRICGLSNLRHPLSERPPGIPAHPGCRCCGRRPRQDSNLRTRLSVGWRCRCFGLWRPRQDSNLRTRLRRPMLYPLSYEGGCRRDCVTARFSVVERRRPALSRSPVAGVARRGGGRSPGSARAGSPGPRPRSRSRPTRCRAGANRPGRAARRRPRGCRAPSSSSTRAQDGVKSQLRDEHLEPVDHRFDDPEDPVARDGPPDDAPPLEGEVHLELVGVGERQHREEADAPITRLVPELRHRGGFGLRCAGHHRFRFRFRLAARARVRVRVPRRRSRIGSGSGSGRAGGSANGSMPAMLPSAPSSGEVPAPTWSRGSGETRQRTTSSATGFSEWRYAMRVACSGRLDGGDSPLTCSWISRTSSRSVKPADADAGKLAELELEVVDVHRRAFFAS